MSRMQVRAHIPHGQIFKVIATKISASSDGAVFKPKQGEK